MSPSTSPPSRAAGALLVACALASFLGSCGGSQGGSGAGGSSSSTSTGTGGSGGDDLPSGGVVQPPTCDGGATTTSTSTGGAGGASTGCEGVGGGVHFAKDVGPILAACTGELCHLPYGYSDLVQVPATECCDGRLLVAPFDAAHSYLVDKVRGDNLCYGGRMPFDTAPLDDPTTQMIVRWVCEGAPKD